MPQNKFHISTKKCNCSYKHTRGHWIKQKNKNKLQLNQKKYKNKAPGMQKSEQYIKNIK